MRGERYIKALDLPFQYQFKQHPVLNVSQTIIPSSQKSLRNQAHSIPCENMCSPHSYHPCHSGSARSSSRCSSSLIEARQSSSFPARLILDGLNGVQLSVLIEIGGIRVAIRVYLPTIFIHLTCRNCSSRHLLYHFNTHPECANAFEIAVLLNFLITTISVILTLLGRMSPLAVPVPRSMLDQDKILPV